MLELDNSFGILFYGLFSALVASLSFNVWLYTSKASDPYCSKEQSAEQLQDLPAGWWTDDMRFQAEKRAIFSKAWICVSHRGRFHKTGDYFANEVAGFRIFLILGKDGQVRTFHNVCRHRAYPVTKKAQGSATVLGCGYHGWSYNTTGALTKAPLFDDLPGFKKEENSLFEIHTKQDDAGFLYINFDRSAEARNSPLPRAAKIGYPVMIYQTSQYLDSWEMKSEFNWKIMVAHNENHDIREGHLLVETGIVADVKSLPALEIYHMSQLRLGLLTTVYTKRGSPFWFLVSYSPDSAGQTTLRCEAYSVRKQHTPLSGEMKKKWGEQLQLKVQEFEKAYRKALRDGPSLSASVYGQALIADQVDVHLEREAVEGKEIRPAAVQASNVASSAAEKLCQAMECGAGGKLDW